MNHMNPWMASRTKTISITSGKGGVGKTTLVSNLAVLLGKSGKKVLLLDGDLGLANLDIFFAVKPQYTIEDVLNENKTLAEIIIPVATNVYLIPSGNGITKLADLNHFERQMIVDSVQTLNQNFDFLIVDTAPGIGKNVLNLNAAAQDVCIVITPDPSSFADAYSLIKILNHDFKERHFSIVCNMVKDSHDGIQLFSRFQDVVQRFLNVGLNYYGSIPLDQALRKANQNQRLIVRHDLDCPSIQAIYGIANEIQKNLEKPHLKSGLQFYFEQVVGMA